MLGSQPITRQGGESPRQKKEQHNRRIVDENLELCVGTAAPTVWAEVFPIEPSVAVPSREKQEKIRERGITHSEWFKPLAALDGDSSTLMLILDEKFNIRN